MATLPTIGVATKEVLTPDDALAQARLQRRMALVQMLQQNAADASNAYGSVNGMHVVPRLGFGPGIAQIAETLMGGLQQRAALKDQQTLAQQMAARQAAAVDSAYGGGQGGSSGASDGTNPNLGLSKAAFADWYRNNPSEALKFAAEHQALTEQNRQYQQQGRDLNDVGALNRAAEVVKGTQTFQPGTTNIVPGVDHPFVAADFSKGTAGGYDANGQPTLEGIKGNQVIAQLAGQQQAAQQANTILPNVTLSNGASVPMWGGQAAAGGAGVGAAPKTFDNQAINTQAAELVNKYGLPPEAADRWIQDQYAKQPGAQINMNPLPAPVPQASGATGIGQSTQDKALADKRAANIAETEQDINDKAASAQAKLANNQKLLALVPQITKGPLAGHITEAKNLLNSLGWSGPDPTNNQEFEKYAMQAALESAKQVYGNRITNADLMSLPHWNPSANMTENALRSIIETDNLRQQRLLQRQGVYNEYRNQGGDLNQFPSWFNKNYPDQNVVAPASATPNAPVQTTGQPAAAPKVLRFNPQTGKLEG